MFSTPIILTSIASKFSKLDLDHHPHLNHYEHRWCRPRLPALSEILEYA